MTKIETKRLIDQYLAWLKEGLQVEELESSCIISTPFLDRHNDEIEVYLEKRGDTYCITDDGYTITDLRQSGVELETGKREAHLKSILNGFGIKRDKDELCVHTSVKDFPQRKHNLIQAIISVNDMFVMGEESVLQLFREDVATFFQRNNIPVIRDLKFSGYSGFDHRFDFGMGASGNRPEAVVQTINRLNRDHATSLAFMVSDVVKVKGDNSLVAYAFLNDADTELNPDNLDALIAYGIKPLRWSDQGSALALLTSDRNLNGRN